MNVLLIGLLVAAGVLIAALLVRDAVYRARHPYSKADVDAARADSINRSRAVIGGKVGEQLAPLLPEFLAKFNPKDARFVGSPIDFVVFDGLSDGNVKGVCFVEIKTGKAGLTPRERHIREAVDAGRVVHKTEAARRRRRERGSGPPGS